MILLKDVESQQFFADSILTCPRYLLNEQECLLPQKESERIYKFTHKCVINYRSNPGEVVKPITSASFAYDIFTKGIPLASHALEALTLNMPLVYVSLVKFKLFKSEFVPGVRVFKLRELQKFIGKYKIEEMDFEKEYEKPKMLYDICTKYCKYTSSCNGF